MKIIYFKIKIYNNNGSSLVISRDRDLLHSNSLKNACKYSCIIIWKFSVSDKLLIASINGIVQNSITINQYNVCVHLKQHTKKKNIYIYINIYLSLYYYFCKNVFYKYTYVERYTICPVTN